MKQTEFLEQKNPINEINNALESIGNEESVGKHFK